MNKHRNNKWSKFLMVLCIAAPITAMVIYMLSSAGIIRVTGILPIALFLLCPLSHLLMLPLMHKAMGKKNNGDENNNYKPSCH